MMPNAIYRPHRIGYFLLISLIAMGLKFHYSRADSGDLLWILAPTAGLVEVISGIPFDYETDTGFVNRAHRMIIAPSCAGVNFLIIAFCMSAFFGLKRFSVTPARLAWVGSSLLIGYLSALTVNALRIVMSVQLYRSHFYSAWLTPEQAHRAGGVALYFLFLSVIYAVLWAALRDRATSGSRQETAFFGGLPRWGVVPAAWYLVFAILIPILLQFYRGWNERFFEHGLTVGIICGVLVILMTVIRLSFVRIADKMGR